MEQRCSYLAVVLTLYTSIIQFTCSKAQFKSKNQLYKSCSFPSKVLGLGTLGLTLCPYSAIKPTGPILLVQRNQEYQITAQLAIQFLFMFTEILTTQAPETTVVCCSRMHAD